MWKIVCKNTDNCKLMNLSKQLAYHFEIVVDIYTWIIENRNNLNGTVYTSSIKINVFFKDSNVKLLFILVQNNIH